jgi:hypothetical protein
MQAVPRLRAAVVLFLAMLALSVEARAASILYTFEGPQFSPTPLPTPLLDRVPNVGDPTFQTDFTATPAATGFSVAPFVFPLFSGNVLVDPGLPPASPADSLLLAFSSPIFALQVDFAIIQSLSAPAAQLRLVTPAGMTSQSSANVGGSFPGGTLFFSSAVPFSTAQLSAFNSAGNPAFFAIDDLRLETTPVPEPGSLVLMGIGLAAALARRRRL